jgi:AdoMet-dependent rRNA methyltransferase SPB1
MCAGGEKGEGEAPADPEDALLAEMAAVKEAMEKRAKKEKKKAREAKKKARIRWEHMGWEGGE